MVKAKTQHTPLHYASWEGNEEVCKLLIETASKQQCNITEFFNAKDHEGRTALHIACTRGHSGVVDLLLRHDVERDTVDWVTSTSPLHLAAKHGHLTLVELLILYGAVIDGRDGSLRTPLHSAAAFNRDQIVELLLENGADPEAKDMLGMTPFLLAVTLGASQSVKVLLDHGAKITATDSLLNSCLHLAIHYGKAEMVKMLLKRDEDKVSQFKDKDLKTVFHLAAGLEDSKILDILMQELPWRDLLNERDVHENTPLHIAATNGSLSCVEYFSNCPKLINDRDEHGFTALHLAASNKHIKTCELLISKGSDVTASDGNGCTALHLAVKAGSFKTVEVLLGRLLPSTLEQKDYQSNTPLHVACMHNRRDILKFLLDKGADVTARNDRNMTCLDVAIEWEAGEVAKTLVRHQRWEEVLYSTLSDGTCPMPTLIEKLPDVAEIILDKCISYSPLPPSHEDFSIIFNFIPLDPGMNDEFEKHFAPATMAVYRRERLLNHKVTQALLRWKWMILGKFVNIFNIALFAAFVILYTCLMVMERDKVNLAFPSSETTTSALEKSKSTFVKTVSHVINVFLVMQIIKEVCQMVWLRLSYFKDPSNLLDFAMFGTAWVFILPHTTGIDLYSMKTQWTAGIVGLAVGDIEAIRKTASLRSLIDQVLLVNHIMKSYPRFILRRAHRSFLEIKPNQNTFINRVALAGCDLTDGDFVDKLLSQESGTDTSSEIWHMKEMQDERRDEMIQKLQATVEAQGKLLQAMADRLKIAV
ncbi:hypothetical protein ACROYT_G021543 [Oculina patagonica]